MTCQLRIGYETSRLVNKDFKLNKGILDPKERLRQFAENNLVKEHFKNDPDTTSQEKWNKVWSFICSDEFRTLRSNEVDKLKKQIDLNLSLDQLLGLKINVVKESEINSDNLGV